MTRFVRATRWVALGWALVALAVVVAAYPDVNQDARGVVVAATVVAVGAAIGASIALAYGRVALGGLGLLASAAAPTFGAAALNLIPVLCGLALLISTKGSGRVRSAS
jgi:hypothetical protein